MDRRNTPSARDPSEYVQRREVSYSPREGRRVSGSGTSKRPPASTPAGTVTVMSWPVVGDEREDELTIFSRPCTALGGGLARGLGVFSRRRQGASYRVEERVAVGVELHRESGWRDRVATSYGLLELFTGTRGAAAT